MPSTTQPLLLLRINVLRNAKRTPRLRADASSFQGRDASPRRPVAREQCHGSRVNSASQRTYAKARGRARLPMNLIFVARVSKPAVSRISKSACRNSASRLGSLRYSRFGNLRYSCGHSPPFPIELHSLAIVSASGSLALLTNSFGRSLLPSHAFRIPSTRLRRRSRRPRARRRRAQKTYERHGSAGASPYRVHGFKARTSLGEFSPGMLRRARRGVPANQRAWRSLISKNYDNYNASALR